MTAVISFLVVLFISLLVVRIAGVALTVTGMPREAARFEARSAWSGTGFTTTQSEQIVRHPLRRRIVTVRSRRGIQGGWSVSEPQRTRPIMPDGYGVWLTPPRVLQAQEVQDSCVEIPHRDRIARRTAAELVRLADRDAAFHAGAHHPAREAVRIMIAAHDS